MVSEQDRDYMRRLGEAKDSSHADTTREHAHLPVIERLRRSFALSASLRGRANLAARVDDPSPFYEMARARGLCDP